VGTEALDCSTASGEDVGPTAGDDGVIRADPAALSP
jgi:hypothetical protein